MAAAPLRRERFAVEVGPRLDSRVTVRVRGDLDYAGGPALSDALLGLQDADVAEVCIDLHAVAFMDSAGLRALLDARHLFPDRLSIRADGRARDLLEVTGCDRFLAIHQ